MMYSVPGGLLVCVVQCGTRPFLGLRNCRLPDLRYGVMLLVSTFTCHVSGAAVVACWRHWVWLMFGGPFRFRCLPCALLHDIAGTACQ